MTRLAPLLLAAAFTGCATFDKNEITSVRGRGVPPPLVEKLDHGTALTPTEVIDLHRYRVPDPWVVRQLEDHDIDSLVTRRDVLAMRRAGVSATVIDATLKASDRFQDRYRYPTYADDGYGIGDPWYGYSNYPYGYGSTGYGYGYGDGLGLSVGIPLGGRYGHYGHHRH